MQIDPEMSAAIVGGLVGAVVGGVVAYTGGWLQARLDRRRKRQSLATIMLSELRIADASIRSFYDGSSGIVPNDAFLSFTLIDQAIDCFTPRTVAAMLDFSGRLDGIRQLAERRVSGATPVTPYTDALMRTLIVVVLDRLEPLAAALFDEGGTYSPFVAPKIPEGLEPGSKAIPPLPQSVFTDLARRGGRSREGEHGGSAAGGAKSEGDKPKER